MSRYSLVAALGILPVMGHGQEIERESDMLASIVVQKGCLAISAASPPADIIDRAKIYAFRFSEKYGEDMGPCTAAANAQCLLVALEAMEEQLAADALPDQNAISFRDADYYREIAAAMPDHCERLVNDG